MNDEKIIAYEIDSISYMKSEHIVRYDFVFLEESFGFCLDIIRIDDVFTQWNVLWIS